MTRSSHGFSLVDVVVGIALLLILFLALFGLLRASLILSTLAKSKAISIELANTQMEYMRGHSYDTLGTVGGIPAGTIPQIATSTVDGVPYVTRTFIEYYDDPADGVGVADSNTITTDYKKGKVTVSYTLYGITKTTILLSNFVPPNGEVATNGGALSLHVVDALGADMVGATVQIVNSVISPEVNFSTFTNASGLATIGGAATSSQYQIFVSRTGYSSSQTYARTASNINPTPGYLTVIKNMTTSSTFAIDRLASLTLTSFSPAVTNTFSDEFDDASNLAVQTNTQVSSETLTLAWQPYPLGYSLSGTARSIPISPSSLTGWGVVSATIAKPSGTSAVIRVADTSGTRLSDAVLPGNSAGFSSFPISLTDIATSSYPGLTLEADLSSSATTSAPSISNWSMSHTEGPSLLPNTSFTLTGTKTIGTDASLLPIYKTVIHDTTGGGASITETLEWDAYSLSLDSTGLIESCVATPFSLAPASATTTAIIAGTPTAHTLPIEVVNGTGGPIGGAKVILERSGYAATVLTSACGLAYFNGLNAGTYNATVSAAGHTTQTFSNLAVSGRTATTTLTLP